MRKLHSLWLQLRVYESKLKNEIIRFEIILLQAVSDVERTDGFFYRFVFYMFEIISTDFQVYVLDYSEYGSVIFLFIYFLLNIFDIFIQIGVLSQYQLSQYRQFPRSAFSLSHIRFRLNVTPTFASIILFLAHFSSTSILLLCLSQYGLSLRISHALSNADFPRTAETGVLSSSWTSHASLRPAVTSSEVLEPIFTSTTPAFNSRN